MHIFITLNSNAAIKRPTIFISTKYPFSMCTSNHYVIRASWMSQLICRSVIEFLILSCDWSTTQIQYDLHIPFETRLKQRIAMTVIKYKHENKTLVFRFCVLVCFRLSSTFWILFEMYLYFRRPLMVVCTIEFKSISVIVLRYTN